MFDISTIVMTVTFDYVQSDSELEIENYLNGFHLYERKFKDGVNVKSISLPRARVGLRCANCLLFAPKSYACDCGDQYEIRPVGPLQFLR